VRLCNQYIELRSLGL